MGNAPRHPFFSNSILYSSNVTLLIIIVVYEESPFQGYQNNRLAGLRLVITIITSESRSLRTRRMSFFNSDEFSNSVTQNIYI